jgi:hypothetical protein
MSKLAEKHVEELDKESNKVYGEINLPMYRTCVEYLDENNGRFLLLLSNS